MENPWVSYVTRSYSTIKASLNNRLSSVVPELTDRSPSNLMQVLMDMWAGVGELLNYYIDTTARELYVGTARRFSSVLKLAELAGYNGRAATPASTYVLITIGTVIDSDITIPQGTKIPATDGAIWQTTSTVVLRKGTASVKANVSQFVSVTVVLGPVPSTVPARLPLPRGYAEDSLGITIDGDTNTWKRVNAFGFSDANDRVFLTRLYSDGTVYVVFGDGVNGIAPTAGTIVNGTFNSTKGLVGNAEANTLTGWADGEPSPPNVLTVTNPDPAYGGRNIQGIEDVRKAIPLSLRTLGRAVTAKDYEDIAMLHKDVRAARLKYDCGTTLTLYIVGHGGGNPGAIVLGEVRSYVLDKSIASIQVETIASGESHVRGEVEITGRYRYKESVIRKGVNEALEELYNYQSSKMNQPVRESDIIAAMDNVSSVDYLDMIKFYVEPYLRPSDSDKVLDYRIQILSSQGNAYTPYELKFVDTGTPLWEVRRAGSLIGTFSPGDPATTMGDIEIVVFSSTATSGDYWTFTVGPWMHDVELNDMSIPIVVQAITNEDFLLNIHETYIEA